MHDEEAGLAWPQVAFTQGLRWLDRKGLAVGVGVGQGFVMGAHGAMVACGVEVSGMK
ncbi:hypothetical protein D3C72_2322860 [compost metagenome]